MWQWSKQFWEETNQKLTSITALAINPSATKLACYGHTVDVVTEPYTASENYGYLFVLGVGSGEIVSGLMEFNYASQYSVDSSSMLFYDSGVVYFAPHYRGANNRIIEGSAPLYTQQLLAWNSGTNTLVYD